MYRIKYKAKGREVWTYLYEEEHDQNHSLEYQLEQISKLRKEHRNHFNFKLMKITIEEVDEMQAAQTLEQRIIMI